MAISRCHRILVVDDNPAIHEDFRKVFGSSASPAEDDLRRREAALFGDDDDQAGFDDDPAPEAESFEVTSALQGQEALNLLEQAAAERRPFVVAFVDMRMPPGWNGIETIKRLWQVDDDLQVVICSAYSDYSPDEISRELGTNSKMLLLRKPFDSLEVRQIAAALAGKWHINRRRGELERMVARRIPELKRLAMQDPLTGLPNRALFNERLNDVVEGNKLDGRLKSAVLFVDIDNFKAVNDNRGHEAGDQMLIQVAERLRQSVREMDTICCLTREARQESSSMAARLGGDEFAILLDGIHRDDDAVTVAERLLSRFLEPLDMSGDKLRCSISIGIATSSVGGVENMLRNADVAMYYAKRGGRARYAVFNENMHKPQPVTEAAGSSASAETAGQ